VKYRVRHATIYRYGKPVDLARATCCNSRRANCRTKRAAARNRCDPGAGAADRAARPFRQGVAWLFLDRPHERFRGHAEATVDVLFPAARILRDAAVGAGGGGGAAGRRRGMAGGGYAFDSPMAPPIPAPAATRPPVLPRPAGAGGPARPDGAHPPRLQVQGRRDQHLTPVARVLAQRAGVCQDFSHLMISGLRALACRRATSRLPAHQAAARRVARRGADHRTPGSAAGSAPRTAGRSRPDQRPGGARRARGARLGRD